ncbi:MAG: PP2C family protein-serine/threonine phosphatase [Bacteroidetes bacterium]|nr:PP2C family protein-serine/threonine phosphatase [Bacteroidota bacterium]
MELETENNRNMELEAKKLQLHWLLQITKAINYNLPVANLFEIYQSVLKEHLGVGSLILLIHEGNWQIPVSFGFEGQLPFTDFDLVAAEVQKISEQNTETPIWFKYFETVVPVFHNDRPLAYALIGNLNDQIFPSKREIITYIHTITNLIVVAIENKRMAKESIRQAAVDRELELAAQMQTMLFPASFVKNSFMDIAATYIPHSSVGGDYYDYIPLNEHEALVCMADVSGKGISAALLMSNFQANLHALIKHTYTSLENLIIELNDCVNRSARGEKFITFFIAKINNATNEIEYINAGHNPPMLVHGNQIIILEQGTTGLGMFEELPFLNIGRLHFPQGSVLFCYTDGIIEMENHEGIAYGTELLEVLLLKHHGATTMEDLHSVMVASFDDYCKGIGYNDDVTFLSVRITG